MQDLYAENSKNSDERNKDDLNKWWKYTVFMDQKTQNVKMSILLKLIYRFNTIPIKIPAGSFFRYEQAESKIHMEIHTTQNSKNNFEKKNNVGGLPVSDFKTYKTTVTQTLWY